MNERRLLLTFLMGMLLVLAVALGTARGSPGILYVKTSASGTADCSNWANACTLQHALEDVAASGDEIWVAAGVYTPTTMGTVRTASFQLVNGVEVYGGFLGTETSRDQRDWESNITVLSGDIDDNDITDPSGVITATSNISGSNSYHVVTSSSVTETCILDGFAITGGYADFGSHPDCDGGGMYNGDSSPTLANLTFSGNWAHFGGGMYNHVSSPELTKVTFTGNSALHYGGAMENDESSPQLTNVTFAGNSAGYYAGGMYNSDSGPQLTNVTFTGNSAYIGGGMANLYYASPVLTNVTFSGNSAEHTGGGMHNYRSSPRLTNAAFTGNSADDYGGGVYSGESSATFINVSFSGNSADNYSGGGVHSAGGSASFTNVGFSGNSAGFCRGMRNVNGTASLANCILWGDTYPEFGNMCQQDATVTISNSLVQDSGGSGAGWDPMFGTDGGGNIDADPQFVDADGPDDTVGTVDDNLRLGATSPAIDAGDSTAVPADTLDLDGDSNTTEPLPFDMDGYPRIVGVSVDMGPYEWPVFLTVGKTVVNDDGGGATVGDFEAYLDGQPVPWGVPQAVMPGSHAVSESVLLGYEASTWGGDCNEDGTITVELGEDAVCSITNDDTVHTYVPLVLKRYAP